jgi:hypothetical protein
MLINVTSYVQTLIDFVDLVEGRRPFANIPTATSLNMHAHEWWDLIGMGACIFTPIAKHILPKSI